MVFRQYVGDELTEMIRAVRTVSVLVGLVGNLIPLYGVLYWQWDAFQLLMLYWTETVIIAFWTILGIRRIPADRLGTINVGGREKPATHNLLCGYFTLVAAMFILGHLGFLWFMFSGEWLKKVSGLVEHPERAVRHRRRLAGADLHVRLGVDFLSDNPAGGLCAPDRARARPRDNIGNGW